MGKPKEWNISFFLVGRYEEENDKLETEKEERTFLLFPAVKE